MIHMIRKLHKPLSLDGESHGKIPGRRLRRSTGPRRAPAIAAILFRPLLGAYGAETRDGKFNIHGNFMGDVMGLGWDWDGFFGFHGVYQI